MPTSFSHIVLCLFTLPLPVLQLLKNYYCYFCHRYRYFHTTLLLNTLLQILSYAGVVELTTQLLILENILWLPLCRINNWVEYSTLKNCCDPLYLWVITGNEIELGMMIPTIESRSSNIPMTKGITYVVIMVRPIKIFMEYV